MKKSLSVLAICMLLGSSGLFAGPIENLYTLVVPYSYGYLGLEGNLGGTQGADALQITMDFSPFEFSVDTGANATYVYHKQSEESMLSIMAQGALDIGTSISDFSLTEQADFRQYGIELGSIPGFYAFGMGTTGNIVWTSGNTSYNFSLYPYAALGIGRIHDIETLKQVELMFKYLAIPLTEENIRTAATYLETQYAQLGRYSEDNRMNYVRFYSDFARDLGVTDRMLSLMYIGQSQEFAFERARYSGLRYGWEAQVAFVPEIRISNGFLPNSFIPIISLSGEYAKFYMENRLHMGASGWMEFGYDSDAADSFMFETGVYGIARYFPDNYRWWFESRISLTADPSETPVADLELNGRANYLFTPNLTGYAGASIVDTFGSLILYAGGRYRIW